MNTTAAAVIVIIIAALILAVMAGITGYTLGRARAADDTKKASEATVDSTRRSSIAEPESR